MPGADVRETSRGLEITGGSLLQDHNTGGKVEKASYDIRFPGRGRPQALRSY